MAGSKSGSTRSCEAWGQFETLMTQPAGRGATVDFRFRNGRRVHFEAHEVLFGKLLKDVKDYISSGPKQIDWQQSDISDIGSRLVAQNQQQYLGRSVAQWDLDLEPPAGHLDRRITVTTPLQKAGAYLLTATMDGGNTSRIVVWLDDTVIIKKPLVDQTYYFVADARTGLPVSAGRRRAVRLADGASGRQERVPRRDQDARTRRPTTRARCRSRRPT